MSALVTVLMQMVTSTTSILRMVIVYGTIHVMNTIEKWSSKQNKSVQVMWYFDSRATPCPPNCHYFVLL